MPDSIDNVALPDVPRLEAPGAWHNVFEGPAAAGLEAVLPAYMMPRRWFGSKARTIQAVRIVESIPILPTAYLTMLRVEYTEGDGETYVLPIGLAGAEASRELAERRPAAVIAVLQAEAAAGVLYDAVWEPRFCEALLGMIGEGRQHAGRSGDLVASPAGVLPRLRGDAKVRLPAVLMGAEQSNTSVRYGDRLILKLYRRLEAGVNPDQEIGQFLTEKADFRNTPPLAGVLEFRRREGADAITIALLQGFVPNRGDAWRYTLDTLADYFAAASTLGGIAAGQLALPQAPLLELIRNGIPVEAERLIGAYLESARLLGRRTAELHLALASDASDPVFAPEPFTMEFQAYLHRSMRDLTSRIMRLLRVRFDTLPELSQGEAGAVLGLEREISSGFDGLLARPIHAMRSRIHGDYHLGQVLYTGADFMIIDFEGEPARALSERKMKRSPLQDVAGMLRSFHYAAYAAYFSLDPNGAPGPELEAWARFWHLWVSVAYLETYLRVAQGAPFLPGSSEELKLLLDAYLIEKAVYELGYELNNRPSWARIPLQGILQTVGRLAG